MEVIYQAVSAILLLVSVVLGFKWRRLIKKLGLIGDLLDTIDEAYHDERIEPNEVHRFVTKAVTVLEDP